MRAIEQGDVQLFELWPHRSLSRRGTALVIGAIALGQAIIIARTASAALWPLLIPALATVAIVAAAFAANNRAACVRETVEIGNGKVTVTRAERKVRPVTVVFDLGWARLDLENDYHVENRLVIRQSGRSVSIGEFLSPDERVELRRALEKALVVRPAAGHVALEGTEPAHRRVAPAA